MSSVVTASSPNNFNSLRLLFATMVAVYHLAALNPAPMWRDIHPSLAIAAELGVGGFFVISGYLVYASFERSKSLRDYADKRARRLLPAYCTVVGFCAASALVFSPAARADLSAVGLYLAANLSFLNFLAPTLPGVFSGNPHQEVNGALWTLKIEVLFYCLLPILAWVIKKSGTWRWALITAIYAGAEAWRIGLGAIHGNISQLSPQLPGQMSFFIVGIALWRLRGQFQFNAAIGAAGVLLLAASYWSPVLEVFRVLGLGVSVLWFALNAPLRWDLARYGDISYGVYITHFPIIQVFIACGFMAKSPALGAGLAFAAIIAASFLLWRFAERPFLRPDSHYLRGRSVNPQLRARAASD